MKTNKISRTNSGAGISLLTKFSIMRNETGGTTSAIELEIKTGFYFYIMTINVCILSTAENVTYIPFGLQFWISKGLLLEVHGLVHRASRMARSVSQLLLLNGSLKCIFIRI